MKKLLLTLSVAVLACACTQAADAAKPKTTPDKGKDKAAIATKSEASCCDSCCKNTKQALLSPRAAALFGKPAYGG
ncbi:MAG TPA: hypothetical protein VN281_06265 [Verrucomicrobiae bacterium]|jgi:hypothetical protein|nr:hypothetical protein [Verrucomicrobiae bacterium]